jgi:hypothetical protein
MFDAGKNLPAHSGIAGIVHLDRHCHVSRIVQSDQQLFLEQTGSGLADGVQSRPCSDRSSQFSLKSG